MLTVLEIALIVVVVLYALFRLLVFAVKRWVQRKIGLYQAASTLVDARFARPARVQLVPAERIEPGAAFAALWARCHALGFRALADLSERNGAFALLRAARHESLPLALVVTEDAAEDAHFAMFALTRENRLIAAGSGPEPAHASPAMSWEVGAAHTPESVFAQLEGVSREHALRALDLRALLAVYESAWAARMDATLDAAPDRAAIESRAAGHTPEQIDAALEMEREQWHAQLNTALLDRYRRGSKMDAVAWERVRDDIRIVHDRLRLADLSALLDGDENALRLLDQFHAQGFSGIALYEQVIERLPAAQRRSRLGTIERPLRAVLYGAPVVGVEEAPARTHTYEALDADGNVVHGALLARDSADAKQQIGELGMSEPKILNQPSSSTDDLAQWTHDPAVAAAAARTAREPQWVGLLRAVRANVWIWGPPLALVSWSLYEGPPYSTGDWLAFALGAVALVVLFVLVAPMVLYNELLRARVHGRFGSARLCVFLLRRVNLLGGIKPHQLLAEECKIDAARGGLEVALARWNAQQSALAPDQYIQGLVSIYDAAGEHARMIEAQRAFIEHAPARDIATIDLALSLARHERNADEAETLLAQVSPANLSELALFGFHFARGLVCAERGQYGLALRQYAQAAERAARYVRSPLMLGLRAELDGYAALALRAEGQRERADAVWAGALPILEAHAGFRALRERYEGATRE